MTNIEMLIIGIKEIANNHGFYANTDYENEGEVCIYGGNNIPTTADVQMLCADCGISMDCVETSDYGIDVFFTEDWFEGKANEEYVGLGFWRAFKNA